MRIDILIGDCWKALYVNNRKVLEDHNIHNSDLLAILIEYCGDIRLRDLDYHFYFAEQDESGDELFPDVLTTELMREIPK